MAAETRGVRPATGCLLSVGLGASGVLIVFILFTLASTGEISFRMGRLREVRFWIVSEGENRGVGVSTPKVVQGSAEEGEVCVQTEVRFILWSREAQLANPSYCECFQWASGFWESLGACPTSLAASEMV